MIVPTRFGLKYAPIPTLALEYEDDLKGVVDATGENSTSLYVYRDGNGTSLPARKLHVVELPMLTKTSETEQITRQLQQDNGRFLAPGVVSETQLKRLLDRLVQNLPDPTQMEESEDEAEEDAKKKRALQSESDISEEEVQSEELEYFSEDGSDEDSF
ncbi:uncharacterized protein PITG_13900 [Phytophthora infestans T30-4]|uniref:Uncharacterized protein n=1 Tax=Phytophthora infestans (strain T30-4) TaxID=403677 RepID=D0NN20_PHYIT|nr:uncharacterized protein PITG_13900 [Phytophthora infestans T30-4]EEY61927.1 conserved hypothetical protein [Phytophthora infestans T30-4]|eukprot:XP_002899567.1 conserved hypothetical protein [Phytophthora infestans T30-4]